MLGQVQTAHTCMYSVCICVCICGYLYVRISVYVLSCICMDVIAQKQQGHVYQHRTHRRAQHMCMHVWVSVYVIRNTAQVYTHQHNSHMHEQPMYACIQMCMQVYAHPRLYARTAFGTSVGRRNAGTELNKASRTIKGKARILVCTPAHYSRFIAIWFKAMSS
jgi:hypothetical protein